MEKDSLCFPPPTALIGKKKPVPYFFFAEEAFIVQKNITKFLSGLYPKGSIERIFNYHEC
jgi:hypothetical protein